MDERTIRRLTYRVRHGRPFWRRARAVRRLTATPAGVRALAGVVISPGATPERVLGLVLDTLAAITGQEPIDEVCRVWHDSGHQPGSATLGSRHPGLGEMIRETGWVASGPAAARVATALHNGRLDLLADAAPEAETRFLAFAPDGTAVAARAYRADGTERVMAWRPEPVLAGRVPVGEVTLAEARRLRDRTRNGPDRAWEELLEALARWRHRYDIELGGAATLTAEPADIELGAGIELGDG